MSFRLMSALIPNSQSPKSNSENIVKQLLECVQECQKRYGSKKELATEFDSCIAGLCLSLEAVFLDGLKNHSNSALKQVSDIVSVGLSSKSDTATFWPFVRRHLTKHEVERYEILKQIWTDTGRGRAWVRASLNERSLERYLHILTNSELLGQYYEDWALLRDQEKCCLLPDMAAGIGSILFAISIDKPELNSGLAVRAEAIKTKTEPIIEAPITGANKDKRHRKRGKVARQFISFDDDENCSLPSSSSSISSDNTSMNETQQFLIKQKKEIANRSALKVMETTNQDKFLQTNVTLTPIIQDEIGELTPISTEINENFSECISSNTSDLIETPTDISLILTNVELKNKEELDGKQEKIDLLTKENENLKEQLKKYVSAIKMLNKANNDDSNELNNLDLENVPNYKNEAKIFERKLVQVAEMHAELMDFNVMLQQNLLKKEDLIEQLKGEIQGPIVGSVQSSVNVWIPSAFLTGAGSASHHVYQIFLRAGNDEWNVYRRYAQFYALHCDLKKVDPVVATFDFPPKKSIGNKDSLLVETRRKKFQLYLRRVIAHWPELTYCNSRNLLEQHLSFFKDQKEVDERNKSIFSQRRSRDSDNHYTGL